MLKIIISHSDISFRSMEKRKAKVCANTNAKSAINMKSVLSIVTLYSISYHKVIFFLEQTPNEASLANKLPHCIYHRNHYKIQYI